MVNGLGVLGWGVGGIEAEAVMLGEPYHMPIPKVFGVRLTGSLREGVTPTDLVLAVTERLRKTNVVGSFVEFFGDGYSRLSAQDRATLGNMSPEYGATVGYCPIDDATLAYLEGTARPKAHVDFVKRYAVETGIFVGGPDPNYSEVIVVDLDRIEPSVAGPRNPEERRTLQEVPGFVRRMLEERRASASSETGGTSVGSRFMLEEDGPVQTGLRDGSVVISAITSCTNTSNPTVMIGAGLIAKKAVEMGLMIKPWVKSSLAPGSTVVTDYLQRADLLRHLDRLGYALVGYGCGVCIGNSGPLPKEVEDAIRSRNLYAVAVLSGNRNFDGRIHPLVKGSFLMSPMLVVAYGLAGNIDFDFDGTPLGTDKGGRRVFLRDIWPTLEEIRSTAERSLSPELYSRRYADATKGDDRWERLASYSDQVFHWDGDSTYIRRPGWFDPESTGTAKKDIFGARALAVLEDKVTTDHISPAGTIPVDGPAGVYLTEHGVPMIQFSSYGSRRGNHEVMVRGGFSNIRLRNLIAKGREGGYTTFIPSGEVMSIFDAAVAYSKQKTPLVVLAGRQYGMGSSRDWAAKAPRLLGVRAVIAEDFERIHRSNLVAMGVLPLQFLKGESRETLGLSGIEVFDVRGIEAMKSPKETLEVVARGEAGEKRFKVLCRVDNSTEMQYIESGGVLPFVLAKIAAKR
jgi:aconitate hydratase